MTSLDALTAPRRIVVDDVLSTQECEELAFIHSSSCTVGYRPHVRSTTLSHLIAANCAPLILPILPIRDRIRDRVEEAFGMQLGLWVEFTGIISWLPGASIGWHADDNRPYLKQRDFSAVCYLNDYCTDFDGGLFRFRQGKPHTVAPKQGRLVAYTASAENEHCVDPVVQGQRLTLTLWFTLNPAHSEDSSLLSLLSRIPLSLRPPFPRDTLISPPTLGEVGSGSSCNIRGAEVEAVSEEGGIKGVANRVDQQGEVVSDRLGEKGDGKQVVEALAGAEVESTGMEVATGERGVQNGAKRRRACRLGAENAEVETHEEREGEILVPIPLVVSDSLYMVQKEGCGGEGDGGGEESGDGTVIGGGEGLVAEVGVEGLREDNSGMRVGEGAIQVEGENGAEGVRKSGRMKDEGEEVGEIDIRIQALASMGWRVVPFSPGDSDAELPHERGNAGLQDGETEWVALVPVLGHGLRGDGLKQVGEERVEPGAEMDQGCIDGYDCRGKGQHMPSRQGGGCIARPALFYNILHALQVAAFHKWQKSHFVTGKECCTRGNCKECQGGAADSRRCISQRILVDVKERWETYIRGLTYKFHESLQKWQENQLVYDCL